MANNDEKYLDGPGLTSILQKSKAITDDHERRIFPLEIMTIPKEELTDAQIKILLDSDIDNTAFDIGDVINTGNGLAICVAKNITLDANGNDTYSISDYQSAVKQLGDTYRYGFLLIPSTIATITYQEAKYNVKDQNTTQLQSIYNSINPNLKSYIDNTVMYYFEYGDDPNKKAYKSNYYLHFVDVCPFLSGVDFKITEPQIKNCTQKILYVLQKLGYTDDKWIACKGEYWYYHNSYYFYFPNCITYAYNINSVSITKDSNYKTSPYLTCPTFFIGKQS